MEVFVAFMCNGVELVVGGDLLPLWRGHHQTSLHYRRLRELNLQVECTHVHVCYYSSYYPMLGLAQKQDYDRWQGNTIALNSQIIVRVLIFSRSNSAPLSKFICFIRRCIIELIRTCTVCTSIMYLRLFV